MAQLIDTLVVITIPILNDQKQNLRVDLDSIDIFVAG